MKAKIINCNTDLGVSVEGTELGPREITKDLKNLNVAQIYNIDKDEIVKSKDKNDLAKNLNSVNNFTKKHYDLVKNIINEGFFPLSIGGDHTIAIGSALASNTFYDDLGIIWVDAHGDYNSFDTTITGNLHGLPLAAITGYNCEKLTDFLNAKYINPKKAVIVGARDIDELEAVNLKNAGVNVFYMEDIRNEGIEKVMEKAFALAGDKVHISYDLDVIDPVIAPGVSVSAEGGITKEEAFIVADIIASNIDKVKSFDLVEYNPLREVNNKTKEIALEILNKVLNTN